MAGERYAYEDEALHEIELYGELIIAAAADPAERLSLARIDEVLRVRGARRRPEEDSPPGRP
ncbi:hypothetical protein [Streptomyces alkaliterrae]|uniref:Uncharacterized protein n=1 Tax=Streptomyces alkaliterrae TaxID=2213162 RepID=A0A5P0YT67_9ACTN|nr:hypothetical protein [Streptomyces alkaliterrae]MBB1255122.1 hypothetical protein [Streptomyces alkaliterrae]MBB1259834.1 hypothetical protein [Streptomyces alkaliterrae]MQS03511.1 hypothetical protein [Streptomyces alkaliterrae]